MSIPPELAGQRLDRVLATLFPEYSRTLLQRWLRDGRVRLDDRCPRQREKVAGGERLEIELVEEPAGEWLPQAIPLEVVYEDEALIVVDKPAGLVVHPGAGNPDGTLLNAVLARDPDLARLPRAGIVHRLDKDTSGLLVLARTPPARQNLIEQLLARSVVRTYVAVVSGVMISGGRIDAPIGRHARDRRRMAVTERGKAAVSHYRVIERYRGHTQIAVRLETGRTHQIRVHLAHRGFPVVGDRAYGGRLRLPPDATQRLGQVLRGFRRQALHARALSLRHPVSGETMSWRSPLPADMRELIEALRDDKRLSAQSP